MPQLLPLPTIGVTLGDPNGIGPELALHLLAQAQRWACRLVLYGPAMALRAYHDLLRLPPLDWSAQLVDTTPGFQTTQPGVPSKTAGAAAYDALAHATADLLAGKLDALLTLPIDKHSIHSPNFQFAGHTEYLQQATNAPDVLMLLVHGPLRVAVVTTHIPVAQVATALTTEGIVGKLHLMDASLRRDFGIVQPQLAVLGLNPHAGDNGIIGTEEQHIVTPAIQIAKAEGIAAHGPFPADGFFAMGAYRRYDGILAMYHDQGLIPFKTLAQGYGVNFTAGLPIVRTSPDHGTAYDIAGQGTADPTSTFHALEVALAVLQARQLHSDVGIVDRIG